MNQKTLWQLVGLGTALAALWSISLYSFLLFHSLAELFSVIIAFCIFVVAWNSRRYLDNGYLLFLGVGYLFVALLDVLHTLAYKGMGVFPGYDANLPTQLWIAARYLQAISLLLAPLFLRRMPRLDYLFLGYSAATGLVLLSLFAWEVFPACYVEGVGLTWFKKISEYVICLILAGAGALLLRSRAFFTARVLHLLLWSLGITILAEIAFTFYVSVYGLSNLLGHFAKIVSFYLIYRALIVTGVAKPQELLFRELKESEGNFRSLFEMNMDGVFLASPDGSVKHANPAACRMLGYSEEEILRLGRQEVLDIGDPRLADLLKQRERFGEASGEVTAIRKGGEHFPVEVSSRVFSDKDGHQRSYVVMRDITERKRVEEALRESEAKYRQLVELAPAGIYEVDLLAGKFLSVNDVICRYTGYTREELLTLNPMDLLTEESRHLFMERLQKIAQGQEVPQEVELQIRAKGGRIFWALLNSRIEHLDSGQVLASVVVSDITERKRAEQNLKEAHRLLDRTQALAKVGGWEYDVAKKKITWTDQVHRIYGVGLDFDPSDIPRDISFYAPESALVIERAFWQCVGQGVAYDLELEFIRAGGERLWVRTMGKPIREGGKIVRVTGNIMDITPTKRAEEELNRQKRFFEQMFMQSSISTQILDKDGWCERINPKLSEIFGVRPEHIEGKVYNIFKDEGVRQGGVLPHLEKVFRGGKTAEWEVLFDIGIAAESQNIPVKEKKKVWYHNWAYPIFDNAGGLTNVVIQHTDITQQKGAEEELRASEEKFHSLFSSMTEIAALHEMVYDTKGQPVDYRIIDFNPAYAVNLGLARDKAIGALASQLYGTGKAPYLDLYAQVAQTGEPIHFETYFEPLRKHFSISAFATGSGRFATIASDVTQAKQAREERRRLEEQLRQAQKMEAVGTLAGGIAHDFNNILAAILGFAEIARDEAQEGQVNPEDLAQIINSAQRAKVLVQQILAFSRKTEPDLRPLNLNHVVQGTEAILQRTLPKMVSIETHLNQDLPLIKADPAQMEQVLLNLASNAQDAMPEGGRLVLETQAVFLDDDYSGQHMEVQPGLYVLLSVSDTGHGMDENTRRHIFEPFFTTKDTGKGTGLGLPSAYGIIKSHGGHIHCYSEPGSGTTFKIYLPVLAEYVSSLEAETDALDEAGLSGSETILLVDDEEALRQAGTQTLQRHGYRVLTASSGEEALAAYRQQGGSLDLAIMDLSMPGMGGRKCLQEILSLNPRAKVIIASGYSANGQVKSSLESGAVDYLAKPFRRADLLSTVRRALDRK
ncbi:MAG: MASE3 domain-containing protein [Thermodesulfobacteriota bacterium]